MNKKIRKLDDSVRISKKTDDSYPVFCFRYLQPYSYNNCSDPDFFIEFLDRLKKLGTLGWNGIYRSARHSFGIEKIPISQIKPANLPSIITDDVRELSVFRATGGNLPFLGIRLNDTFQIIFIETSFGEIYKH